MKIVRTTVLIAAAPLVVAGALIIARHRQRWRARAAGAPASAEALTRLTSAAPTPSGSREVTTGREGFPDRLTATYRCGYQRGPPSGPLGRRNRDPAQHLTAERRILRPV